MCLSIIKYADMVEAHAIQALVETRQHVLARAPLPIRAGPHQVPGFGRDDELVAMTGKVSRQDPAEVLLRRAGRRAVVVREVEMRDPQVECPPNDLALNVDRPLAAKVLPQAKRDGRQLQPAAAAAPIL